VTINNQTTAHTTKAKNILLTGTPGCGKTTVVIKTARLLRPFRVSGFHTEEIRRGRVRVGFKIVTFAGEEGVLAHVRFTAGPRVSRYTVDIDGFERLALPVLDPAAPADVFIIDEIGKMECFSKPFQEAVRRLLDLDGAVLATIARKGPGIISELKTRPDVALVTVTLSNRNELPQALAKRIRDYLA